MAYMVDTKGRRIVHETHRMTGDGGMLRLRSDVVDEDSRGMPRLYDVEANLTSVDGSTMSYRVTDVGPNDIDAVMAGLPAPVPETDGTEAHLATDRVDDVTVLYLRPTHVPDERDAHDRTRPGRMYAIAGYGSADPVEGPYAPRFRAVAIDETRDWNEDITAVMGRIKGVYVYDAARVVHMCEITPSYELAFVSNEPEALFPDEDVEETAATAAGFADYHAFRHLDAREGQGMAVHCRQVDAMTGVDIPSHDGDVDEYMLCRDEGERERLHRNLMDEACSEANGNLIDEPFPEGRKHVVPELSAAPASP